MKNKLKEIGIFFGIWAGVSMLIALMHVQDYHLCSESLSVIIVIALAPAMSAFHLLFVWQQQIPPPVPSEERREPSIETRLWQISKVILAISLNVVMWGVLLAFLPFVLSFGVDKTIPFSQNSFAGTFIINLLPILFISLGYLMLKLSSRHKLAQRLCFIGFIFSTPVASSGGTPSLFSSYFIYSVRWHKYLRNEELLTVLIILCIGGALAYFIAKYSSKLFLHIKDKLWGLWFCLHSAVATLFTFFVYQLVMMLVLKLIFYMGFKEP